MSKDEVLKLLDKPTYYEVTTHDGIKWVGENRNTLPNHTSVGLYTEAKALAMYAKGQEDMMEMADDAWAAAIQSDCEHGVKFLSAAAADVLHAKYPALAKLGEIIRALPITTTEGEQG